MGHRSEIIHGISATRASAILGMNQWKTPLLAWQEIQEKRRKGFNAERGYVLPPREDKAVFRWGTAFESAVIELAEQAQVDGIKDREKLFKDNRSPPAFCYVDGIYQSMENGLILCEAKTTFDMAYNRKWGEPGTDRVPAHIAIQVQHQLMCSGADGCIVSVLVFPFNVEDREDDGWTCREHEIVKEGEFKYIIHHEKHGNIYPCNWAMSLAQQGFFHTYHITAKPEVHKLLREMYDDFWANYVLTEKPPEITDYDDLKRLFPEPKGDLVVPEDVQNMLREFSDINKELGKAGHLSRRKEALKVEILKYANTATTVADDDAVEKVTFLDDSGNRLGSYNGKMFRC